TTGFMLHFYQTGDSRFRDAVIKLAEWELRALEGSGTVLATLKRGLGYALLWWDSRGNGRLFPRYPLTRGTGNAVSSCLDAFEVGGARRFLDRAEELLRGALHPEDDLEARRLLEAETAWSYTVLLAALVKFLDKKRELGELDAGFQHARAALHAYAGWMLAHERPYLDHPEILEYPNETWAAQDLRKSVIFYHAARYGGVPREALLKKARFFFRTSNRELARRDTSKLTRPLTLMLQNGWVGKRLESGYGDEEPMEVRELVVTGSGVPVLTLGEVALRNGADLLRALSKLDLKSELAWIKASVAK